MSKLKPQEKTGDVTLRASIPSATPATSARALRWLSASEASSATPAPKRRILDRLGDSSLTPCAESTPRKGFAAPVKGTAIDNNKARVAPDTFESILRVASSAAGIEIPRKSERGDRT